MINNLSSIFIKHGIIEEDDKEIYDYGLFVVVFNLLSITSIVLLGMIFKRTLFTFYFLLFYLPNRMIIGGYHCKTPLSCFLTFTLSYSIILILSYIVVSYENLYIASVIIYLLLLLLFFKRSKSFIKSLITIFVVSLLFTCFCDIAKESFVYATMINFILYFIANHLTHLQ